MCLAVPGKIVTITDDPLLRMGDVDFGGVVKRVCLGYLPDAQVGEYVVVHVGFAIQRLDEDAARQSLELLTRIGLLEEELAGTPSGPRPGPRSARDGEGAA